MTIASRIVTRRALIGAGALLVAGCGPPSATAVAPADVLNESLRAVRAAEAVHDDRGARRRVTRLEAAVRDAGGTPATDITPVPNALAGERAALRAHVAAVGQLGDAPSRELLAGLIAETAEAVARLSGRTASFPGQPL